MRVMSHARRTVSFALLVKSAVGVGVSTLALFGVAVPRLGFELSATGGTGIALVGAVIGATIAFYS